MNLIHPDVSLVPLLQRITATDVHYWLYAANVTPDKDTTLADLTAANLAGPTTVASGAWTLSGVAGRKGALISAPVAIVSAVSTTTFYGYYVTDSTDTELLACARFDTPVVLNNTESHNVIPILGDSSFYPV